MGVQMGTDHFITRYMRTWGQLSFYEKFEQIIAILLAVVISIVIVGAFVRLSADVFLTFATAFGSLDERIFEEIFGRIMIVLIALEFNHSILHVLRRQAHIIQVRTVVLIAILAIARKVIVLDIEENSAETLIALAVIAAALAALHWVLAVADRKEKASE